MYLLVVVCDHPASLIVRCYEYAILPAYVSAGNLANITKLNQAVYHGEHKPRVANRNSFERTKALECTSLLEQS
jgi:hypothetical protein